MSRFVEFVTYRVKDTPEEEFLRLRSAAVAAVEAAHPALVAVPVLARRPDGSWVDVWVYETEDDARAANEDAANIPAFTDFARVLEGVEIEAGAMPHLAISPR
ncbi:hypothetical protein [Amycolatopsis sp. MtRt-6]|uniref:hypothetical protein n=1 Tax=Amycolatopsis sp. MtRt-6 TaxID=2792782 RepID=UPI001A8E35F8|nr:hypothetical protein [Amycolatopsis sp. MtRt-6]